jgi:hypothetical protein
MPTTIGEVSAEIVPDQEPGPANEAREQSQPHSQEPFSRFLALQREREARLAVD